MAVNGKVVHYDSGRGFGFIAPDNGGDDVFIHINDIDVEEDYLKPGASVQFDIEDGERGPKAVRVVATGDGGSATPRGDKRPAGNIAGTPPGVSSGSVSRRERGKDVAPRDSMQRDASRKAHASGTMTTDEFVDELTEILLDSDDSLTAGQILSIRQRLAEFAFARGWVSD